MRSSLSGNLVAKSSAAFSCAAASVVAAAALYASNSGCVLACGGRLTAGWAAAPGAAGLCPAAPWAGGAWAGGGPWAGAAWPAAGVVCAAAPVLWAAAQIAMVSIPAMTAARFMLSPVKTGFKEKLHGRLITLSPGRGQSLLQKPRNIETLKTLKL